MLNAKEKIKQIEIEQTKFQVLPNINPIDEWIKWLEYKPEFQKNRIEELQKRSYSELSIDELQEIFEYFQEEAMLDFFKNYRDDTATEEECTQIYKYMQKNILTLCNRKLSEEEKKEAVKKISEYETKSQNELNEKIYKETCSKEYNTLSMVDSYVLHILYTIACARKLGESDSVIESNKLLSKHLKY